MIGSTTPVAKQPDCHPVHRANALLRAALLTPAHSAEPSVDWQSVESLSCAIASVMKGPVSITYPATLAARLDALAVEEDGFPAIEGFVHVAPRWGEKLSGVSFEAFANTGASERLLAQTDASPGEASPEAWDEGDDGYDFGEAGALTVGAPLDPETLVLPPQVHVQALLRDFRRRQRHASLLVAGSIATAVLLTLGGLVLVANLAAPRPADSDNRHPPRSTSVAWQRPANSNSSAGLQRATVSANRAAKGEPLRVPALAGLSPVVSGLAPSLPQTILATSGRHIAFAPLLPPSHVGYLLIRGLPPEAELSAGRKSGSGTWLVKGEHVHDLTLSIGEAAEGDYPIEVYVLQSGDGPQARRSLVLRVEAPTRTYAMAGPDMGWASALLDVVPSAHAAEEPAVPAEAAVLRERAKRLLDEGDIAAARLLLLHLAERGEGEAAYELARTFDREMLAALGAIGMDGDPARARGWYERASQDGNAKATERLKVLASLSGTDPSD
jgi:hypothetical protein